MRLLDINILIARADPSHADHAKAVRWFADYGASGWATCPLTENGFARILGHPAYPEGPGSPERAARLLRELVTRAVGHCFLPDHVSLLDPASFPTLTNVSSKQITDLYLLALAVNHNVRFLTFDQKIDPSLIPGGPAAYEILS